MDRTRFNQQTPRARWPIRRRSWKSILLPDPGEPRTEQHKRFFAVVSESISEEGKAIRRVLIFDDTPASLRLLSTMDALDLEPGEQHRGLWVVLGWFLVVLAGLGVVWPLLS
jgi:hypothetical protein